MSEYCQEFSEVSKIWKHEKHFYHSKQTDHELSLLLKIYFNIWQMFNKELFFGRQKI